MIEHFKETCISVVYPQKSLTLQVRSLEAVGSLCPVEAGRAQSAITTTLIEHTSHQDNRVRTAAFNALVSNFLFLNSIMIPLAEFCLPINVYHENCYLTIKLMFFIEWNLVLFP